MSDPQLATTGPVLLPPTLQWPTLRAATGRASTDLLPAGAGDELARLPWRQALLLQGDAQAALAQQPLLDGLARPQRFCIRRLAAGGALLHAASEEALRQACGVLQGIYGDAVEFGAPGVHHCIDQVTGATLEPVGFLRIDSAHAAVAAVLLELRRRGAAVQDLDLLRGRAVVRAEIALRAWIGGADAIAGCTDGDAQVRCWLLRWQPVGQGAQGKDRA